MAMAFFYRYKDIRGWWERAHCDRGVRAGRCRRPGCRARSPIRFSRDRSVPGGRQRAPTSPTSLRSQIRQRLCPRHSTAARTTLIQAPVPCARSCPTGRAGPTQPRCRDTSRRTDLEMVHAIVGLWMRASGPAFPTMWRAWSERQLAPWSLDQRTDRSAALADVVAELSEREVIDYDVDRLHGLVRGTCRPRRKRAARSFSTDASLRISRRGAEGRLVFLPSSVPEAVIGGDLTAWRMRRRGFIYRDPWAEAEIAGRVRLS